MDPTGVAPPASMLAEVTHRCPVHCLYCSNPLELVRRAEELTTEVWLRVLDEAAGLGVLQVHFSGGEPLQRQDLGALVERSSRHQLYSNLITSGVGLTRARARALRDAGLGAVQVSVQAARPDIAEKVAGGEFWKRKMDAAHAVKEAGLPLSLNVVLHRHNLNQVTELLELARTLGAERVELANTQYYGWALLNRDHLLPDREMLARAEEDVDRFRRQDHGAMEIVWVVPDYFAEFPKPCMNGWGRMFLTVTPDGTALPCPVASVIPDLHPPSVRNHALRWIWYESPAFNRYRGTEWMPEPCSSCPRRTVDFGGCRCQAYLLTGNPAATDPVCTYSPDHRLISEAMAGAGRGSGPDPSYRKNPEIARPHPL